MMKFFSFFKFLKLKSQVSENIQASEQPLRDELYSVDQLERFGETLATTHQLAEVSSSDILLERLHDNEITLNKIHRSLSAAISQKNQGTPAIDWLLDNFYLIEEQIQMTKMHLPKGYGRSLPVLANGLFEGCPRVYDIALRMIAHGDSRWDTQSLSRAIAAYQEVHDLTLGELWAIPIMLRLALIENIRRIGAKILANYKERALARAWADRMIKIADTEPKNLIGIVADMARSNPPMQSAFVADMVRHLKSRGSSLALPLTWIEQRLGEMGSSFEEMIQLENQQQVANQITISNSITSLRRLGETNWKDFVEDLSRVHKLLETDPCNTYARMDFLTRDHYRHQIEALARQSAKSEIDVTQAAIHLAREAQNRNETDPVIAGYETHVGYYLIDAGRPLLEKTLCIHHNLRQKLKTFFGKKPLAVYLSSIALISFLFSFGMLINLKEDMLLSLPNLIFLLCIFTLAASQMAIEIINFILARVVAPKPLPRLDFTAGIPNEYRTLVVIPTIIASISAIENLVEALEVRYLGNRDESLHFALATDFTDAPAEHMSEDNELLQYAIEKIQALNLRYPHEDGDSFFLLHRPRTWNPAENVWMGYERKRGKLCDVNTLLLEANTSAFSCIIGDPLILSNVKYVITLDTDTELPRDAAKQLIATMAHPLNCPCLDANKQRVTRGYGILQPRIAEVLSQYGTNRYTRLCGLEPGIDPYTRMVSDVYQDVFREGSFTGKGIYNVAMFEKVLKGRFPANRILSHDLLEGCYLRSGLVEDVPLYEQSPDTYIADTKRRARWIRGDWQLLPYLSPMKGLSLLSRFKLFDNLRRSLIPASLLILILFTLILPLPLLFLGIGAILCLPSLISIFWQTLLKPAEIHLRQHLFEVLSAAQKRFEHILLQLTTLPYETSYSLKAILRTLWRMGISHKHLLEWTPFKQENSDFHNTALQWLKSMRQGPVLALALCAILYTIQPLFILLFMLPLLALWLASPFVMAWLSKPFSRKKPQLTEEELCFLRVTARKTWAFFEKFVGAEDHYLPPDNFQDAPKEAIAHRTSPTNIGLTLLANLTAYDFGYIDLCLLLTRTRQTLETMLQLERYQGHFYNWYDTTSLHPLPPRYISTVDSGNLAGHLMTLQQGLLMLKDEPVLNPKLLDGLEDTLNVLAEYAGNAHKHLLLEFDALLQNSREAFSSWPLVFSATKALSQAAQKTCEAFLNVQNPEARIWADKLREQSVNLETFFGQFQINADVRDILPAGTTLNDMMNSRQDPLQKIAQEKIALLDKLAGIAASLSDMKVDFLYDATTHLMSIGYNVDLQQRDRGNYDLLSSEARLGVFVAIAQGQIPQEAWFALGRRLVSSNNRPILMSWSGSMFEYLMPMLVMPNYENTLLDQTCKAAVKSQIHYGRQRGVPWGISESGYNALDAQLNYQYRAFGVPGLGLKAGLAEELVIAPYASLMALMVAPDAATMNLEHLARDGAEGQYGFYEALDFTPSRLPRGSRFARVNSFMTHHQGMAFLALSYVLHDEPMQKRFGADPLFQAALLLLQERSPRATASYIQALQSSSFLPGSVKTEALLRVFDQPNTPFPEVQLLSNGNYQTMLTQAGSGYSRWKNIMLTRWREDATRDQWGLFGYLCDVVSGKYWSTTYQPLAGKPKADRAVFSEGHVEFSRRVDELDLYTDIAVSPEDDVEVRRLKIHNPTRSQRVIEFTSYAEVVLNTDAADLAHPAFSNLFVETRLQPARNAIIATRRPRSETEEVPWLCHMLTVSHPELCAISFETDRSRFIGRTRNPASALAMLQTGPLSGTCGAVLDPIIAIRCRITLEPGSAIKLDLTTGVSATEAGCEALIEKYCDRKITARVFNLSWTHSQVLLQQLNISEANAQLYSRIASNILYANNSYRAEPSILATNRRGQSALWPYSISGDLPIVLFSIENEANIELVKQLIQAHSYWSAKGLAVDLIILNEEHSNYRQVLHDQIADLLTAARITDQIGHIYLLATEQMPFEDRILLHTVARVIFSDKRGTLAEQLNHRYRLPPLPESFPVKISEEDFSQALPDELSDLTFYNGIGGFSEDGREYIMRISAANPTPAPWINILSNPEFGTVLSESGQAYTFTENAQQFRLTPWENDALQDRSGEAFYLRDEESGHTWSPTLLPCKGQGEYEVRHGFGYSVFTHMEAGIYSELWVYVAIDAPVKCAVLKLKNLSDAPRRLSATGYVEWVLGESRTKTNMYVVTESNEAGTVFAQNRYNSDWGERTAFFGAATPTFETVTRTFTADRTEFLGRNNSPAHPLALKRSRLSGRVGAGLDPCAALELAFDLGKNQSREIVFSLGAAENFAEAENLARRFGGGSSGLNTAREALSAVQKYWQDTLGTLNVSTPDPALNYLANGWLLYQTITSRLFARSGYYQSGGAFGFRDQLQDVMALVHVKPEYTRAQLLRSAAQQFIEGDVQHWWHPPQNRGVRTRCSDDYLWLPFTLCRYVTATEDFSILDESVNFLYNRLLNPLEESYYDLPLTSEESGTLYQHGARAILNGLRFGEHGLPLMGSGDWNDGMNLVGEHGRGESIWLGFFLYTTLKEFAKLALHQQDAAFAARCETEAALLQQNIEKAGWDGQWYRRAYFDDGKALGSHLNTECRIDSIAQSWAALSGAGDPARTAQAIVSLNKHLVRYEDRLIQLLNPPFDHSDLNPGYIKGYLPGVRENGGQYTQSAVWAAMASAKMGERQLAWDFFDIINPINHGRTPAEIATYKVEPYVISADVYAVAPHIGRGGWSWYTGSAAWIYRLITESLLGFSREGALLRIQPCMNPKWKGFRMTYRYGNSNYHIEVAAHDSKNEISLDGVAQSDGVVRMQDDGLQHAVKVLVKQ